VNRVLDAFWRALAYCLHPRVILWSLLPLALAGGTVLGLGWFLWVDAIDAVRAVCLAGEVMPEKSTYFYPKLADGLVFDLFDGRWS